MEIVWLEPAEVLERLMNWRRLRLLAGSEEGERDQAGDAGL